MKDRVVCNIGNNLLTDELALAFRNMNKRNKHIEKLMHQCINKPLTIKRQCKKTSIWYRIWKKKP